MVKLSIGLPVYNGGRYLRRALDTLLSQRFTDFELIACDNQSTDNSWEVLRAYAAQDRRLHPMRNERNIGASPNFNRVFTLAAPEARYFKWAAHDDEHHPDFLAECIDRLDRDPRLVMAYTRAVMIDDAGAVLDEGDRQPLLPDSDSPSDRFAPAILDPHCCRMVFGVIRKRALEQTQLHLCFDGSDRNLIAELALLGRFAHIDRPLFLNRDHPWRYVRAVRLRPEMVMSWHQPDKADVPVVHRWESFRAYVAAVHRHVPDPGERLRCWGHLARWQVTNNNLPYMVVEAAGVLSPTLFRAARLVKRRLAGA